MATQTSPQLAQQVESSSVIPEPISAKHIENLGKLKFLSSLESVEWSRHIFEDATATLFRQLSDDAEENVVIFEIDEQNIVNIKISSMSPPQNSKFESITYGIVSQQEGKAKKVFVWTSDIPDEFPIEAISLLSIQIGKKGSIMDVVNANVFLDGFHKEFRKPDIICSDSFGIKHGLLMALLKSAKSHIQLEKASIEKNLLEFSKWKLKKGVCTVRDHLVKDDLVLFAGFVGKEIIMIVEKDVFGETTVKEVYSARDPCSKTLITKKSILVVGEQNGTFYSCELTQKSRLWKFLTFLCECDTK